jgi:hypothetical protein
MPLLEGTYQAVNVFETDIGRLLIEENLGCGVAEECLILGVTERDLAQVASGILEYRFGFERLFDLPWGGLADFTLPSPSRAVSSLIDGGYLGVCEVPLDSNELLDRGRAAYLLLAWIGDVEPRACPTSSWLFR